MKKKLFFTVLAAFICVFVSVFAACGGEEDGMSWKLGADGGIYASLSDNGKYGFILTLEGSGAMPAYSSKKDAPWYKKSGRITDIVLSEGITAVGAHAFTDCRAEKVIIPHTVTAVGEKAFNAQTVIYAYSALDGLDGYEVYLYSETAPEGEGSYWHEVNGAPAIWKQTKILFIGNSFTYYNDIPKIFENIALSAGLDVAVESVTQGSWFLTKFADGTDDYGKIVEQKLNSSDDYDVIVLQEQSVRPIDNYAKFSEGATGLKQKIEKTQKNCEIYLYATWGYPLEAGERKITVPEMELKLRTAYEKLAGELGVKVSQVGKAFTTVYNGYPGYNLYHTDNRHPSYIGSFLSACVHAATILDIDLSNCSYSGNLDEATAAVLKSVAMGL